MAYEGRATTVSRLRRHARISRNSRRARVRTRPTVRATVTDLLTRARRDSAGRELRGLAYRMGIAG